MDIRVVDPLRVPDADFELRVAGDDADLEDAVDAYWTLTNVTMLNDDDPDNDFKAVHESSSSIALLNEELLLDWGISVTVHQYAYPKDGKFTEPVHASITLTTRRVRGSSASPMRRASTSSTGSVPATKRVPTTCLRKSSSTTSRRATRSTRTRCTKASWAAPGHRTAS